MGRQIDIKIEKSKGERDKKHRTPILFCSKHKSKIETNMHFGRRNSTAAERFVYAIEFFREQIAYLLYWTEGQTFNPDDNLIRFSTNLKRKKK